LCVWLGDNIEILSKVKRAHLLFLTAFTGVKHEVGHFRIFGCPVYIHVPKEKRMKLDPSSRKGTFVGYNESSKAYQIYILGQRQIEVSMDVFL
jgi:hypothetical protein